MERQRHVALCSLAAAACFLALQLAQNNVVLTVLLLAIVSTGIFAIAA